MVAVVVVKMMNGSIDDGAGDNGNEGEGGFPSSTASTIDEMRL